MRTLIHTAVVASLLAASGAVFAQAQAVTPVQGLTRAQVLADLQRWQQAGMTTMPDAAAYPEIAQTAEYKGHLAEYQRLSQLAAADAASTTTVARRQQVPTQN